MKFYNISKHRIGDRVAACYQLIKYQYVMVIDNINPEFDIKDFFPNNYLHITYSKEPDLLCQQLRNSGNEELTFHNLWITSPNVLKKEKLRHFMEIPTRIRQFQKQITAKEKDKNRPIQDYKVIIGIHCLLNAPYNIGRNHNYQQFEDLKQKILTYCTLNNIDFVILPIPTDNSLTIEQIIGIIDLCDIWIGGDTGFTHIAAALNKEIIAIYGNDEHDVKAFQYEADSLGCEKWCSDPLTTSYKKFVMENHLFNMDEVEKYLVELINKKNG
jgi:hypothetical protein